LPYKKFKCKWIYRKDLYRFADDIRSKYWPENSLPIDMEKIIELVLGLDIEPMHGLFSMIDTEAWLKMDLTGIVVDYDRYMNGRFINRLRFSLAHELGHYFLHKGIYSKLSLKSLEEWKTFMTNVSETEYKAFEWQADEFAGRFLVPYDSLVAKVHEAIEIIKQQNLVEYLGQEPDAVLSSVAPFLRKAFVVSEQVIKIRVQNEELWPPKIS
jgi:IrrE N-terminal-like domain